MSQQVNHFHGDYNSNDDNNVNNYKKCFDSAARKASDCIILQIVLSSHVAAKKPIRTIGKAAATNLN